MSKDDRYFSKAFFDMIEMVKVLYYERTSNLQGESSNKPKGNGVIGASLHLFLLLHLHLHLHPHLLLHLLHPIDLIILHLKENILSPL